MAGVVTPPAEGGHHVFTNDPVRIVWVTYSFVQAVVIALTAAGVLADNVSTIITTVMLAAYIGVSELFVRPETVPRQPLEELARAEAASHPPDATA